ncbi:hypothetical protein LTR46_011499 [Exophiala xenobiotica]|nr:hypothetical protein LTR46_011499 [Exophiala xenobiotica]
MAPRDSVTAQKTRRRSVKLPHQGHLSASSFSTRLTSKAERPQGIKKGQKQNPPRRSARLDRLVESSQRKAREQPLPSPVSDIKSPNTYHWPRRYFTESGEMSHLLARKKSATSLRRKRSDSESGAPSSTTPSDQKPREEKSTPYQDPRYRSLLEAKGSFMSKYVGRNEEGPTAESQKEYKSLLEAKQPVPEHSLFQDDFFEETCEMIQDRNEAKVIQDIARLIVPSAQSLAVRGAKHLRCLIESVNEGWNNSIPVTKTRPQPDYSVGFKRSAFTEDQLQKLQPFVGDLFDNSFFMGTWYMYFPFFSSEVKCGAAALDVADRQNAHSMTLAVRGVVELFRLVKREKELHREILAFSISHDNETVRIYGHYPVIKGKKTTFYRHPIHKFSFTTLDGKEKWTAYKFTKSVYDIWMPVHFKRLCSAIDAIPLNIRFEVSEESDLQFPSSSGLSQGLESHHLSESAATDDDGLSFLDPQEVTPDTSITQAPEPPTFKKPKKS